MSPLSTRPRSVPLSSPSPIPRELANDERSRRPTNHRSGTPETTRPRSVHTTRSTSHPTRGDAACDSACALIARKRSGAACLRPLMPDSGPSTTTSSVPSTLSMPRPQRSGFSESLRSLDAPSNPLAASRVNVADLHRWRSAGWIHTRADSRISSQRRRIREVQLVIRAKLCLNARQSARAMTSASRRAILRSTPTRVSACSRHLTSRYNSHLSATLPVRTLFGTWRGRRSGYFACGTRCARRARCSRWRRGCVSLKLFRVHSAQPFNGSRKDGGWVWTKVEKRQDKNDQDRRHDRRQHENQPS